MLKGLKIDSLNMETPIEKGMLLATDIADYLVKKGLTFRDSYSIVSELSDFVASSNKELADITLLEFKEFSEFFSEDVKSITPSSSIESRNIPGGTSTEMVSKAIANARKKLSELDANEL